MGSAATKSMASATQICGPKSCVSESIPNDFGANTRNTDARNHGLFLFCLGSGGILRWKKSSSSQTFLANLHGWPFFWGNNFKWPVDSKVVTVTSQVWGDIRLVTAWITCSVGLSNFPLVWFVVVSNPMLVQSWFNQIENRLFPPNSSSCFKQQKHC